MARADGAGEMLGGRDVPDHEVIKYTNGLVQSCAQVKAHELCGDSEAQAKCAASCRGFAANARLTDVPDSLVAKYSKGKYTSCAQVQAASLCTSSMAKRHCATSCGTHKVATAQDHQVRAMDKGGSKYEEEDDYCDCCDDIPRARSCQEDCECEEAAQTHYGWRAGGANPSERQQASNLDCEQVPKPSSCNKADKD